MNQTEQSLSHVETLRRRIGGHTDSELFQARRADEAAEERRLAAAQAAMFKANEERARKAEAKHRADAAVMKRRKEMVLARKCEASLGGCTAVAANVYAVPGEDLLRSPAWAFRAICDSCLKQLPHLLPHLL